MLDNCFCGSTLDTTTECKRRKVVNIMWIMIILLMVVWVVFVMSMMKVASITDDQSERWAAEHMNDRS